VTRIAWSFERDGEYGSLPAMLGRSILVGFGGSTGHPARRAVPIPGGALEAALSYDHGGGRAKEEPMKFGLF
jgi:hypothetical protein